MNIRIAQVVREKRKIKKLTQEKLAEIAGVSSGYIGQIERGEINLSITTIANLISILGIDANTLFYEDTSDNTVLHEITLRASRLPAEDQHMILEIIAVFEEKYRKETHYENSNLR